MPTIALAEDHLQMRGCIKLLTNQLSGYSVSIEAADGIELIQKLQATKELPFIAMIDVEMPKMDGLALTYYLSKHYPSIHILVVSSHRNPMIALDMLYAGAKGYLLKSNLCAQQVLQAFGSLASGELFIDEELGPKEVFESALNLQHSSSHSLPHEITEKEKLFLQLVCTTASYEQIAQLMHVAETSIYNYQKSLKEKTGLGSRQEYMLYAIQHGIAKVARLDNPTH
jgi:two-component system invasion response regulator UvrY